MQRWQFVARDVALDDAEEVFAHALRRHLREDQRIELRLVGNDADVVRVAVVARASMALSRR